MQYLCFCCDDEKHWSSLGQDERDALIAETFEYVESLRKSGHLIDARPLKKVDTAATVRVRNGKLSTTDGPFAETKEQIGGFFLIEAEDFNEAIRIAGKWPPARIGSVEVRPVEAELDRGSGN